MPLDTFADRLDVDVRLVLAFAGEPVPALEEVGDGLVVLGGHMSAHDDAAAPWLPATRDLLAGAAHAGVPTLGICLGAQLLAVAGGGRVQVAAPPGREAGLTRLFWRAGAAADPVVGLLAASAPRGVSRTLSLHADAVVDLPPGAVWLASSNMYPYQAFRLGSALGVQFHPEASPALVERWAASYEDVDGDALAAEVAPHADEVAATGRAVADGFLAQVREHALARRPAPA